ncbi:hypothetical protein [Veillonella atypica]|jgi:hypothetical protein|uniref:Uncharacterized protein n=1 Tax=Veillonella atypica TaxID=39777 RepID=A0A3A6WKB9_9FIRM|nr:hypothetical protein [Veillonella atypica]RJY49980.1 hypothetical protein D2965_08420 [Veillonella atypica]DAH88653.1 MAG TPA: BAG-family molecular chaperone regulator [Caudoviricetes sp.]DAL43803.1 MAG TPA_asm: BAG-family molecular chaperone regulator [Bacteriophage sp.]DAR87989.1 MAG TPA: BAG-family molecular chaperone regulator [Caudoviricetes sp.]
MLLKILFKLEAISIEFQAWLRLKQKQQIEKLIEENESDIAELKTQNSYLKGLLKNYAGI